MRRLIPVIACLLFACSSDPGSADPEDTTPDASSGLDANASSPDAAADVSPDAPPALDAGGVDAGVDDAGRDAGRDADTTSTEGLSPCEVTAALVDCPKNTTTLLTDLGGLTPREVHWQNPEGDPPAGGWPVVLLFQGTGLSSEEGWELTPDAPFGGYYQALLTHELLDAGFSVLAPEVRLDGSTYWDTNISPWSISWTLSGDHQVMLDIFDELEAGAFGPADLGRMYATGISSGGYMTSRMAEAYAGRFRALAIQSASYAWCAGALCTIPSELPENHPPTLFLHGATDAIVPLRTMNLYYDALIADGVEVSRTVDPDLGHEWLPSAPDQITAWFLAR